ncbi:MAG: molybdopterin molybdotransferase MoeA [gamma proteobacterium symbiont of Taylorina sp.]|nr:molybdopterin molybdotransferase MoeA [gamma proteobacterium symbiont of Taylorina sp.]
MNQTLNDVITVSQAQSVIKQQIDPLVNQQIVILPNALGKTLAQDVISPMNVPVYQNSAMDGYAFNSQDISEGSSTLKNCGTSLAGTPFEGTLTEGQCIRIMTGAKIPDNVDTVIEQEKVRINEDYITINVETRAGQNIRNIGEDITKGSVVLAAGQKIGAAQLGVLASLGLASLKVKRQVRVAVFSSGDEIRSIGETLDGSQIYDSNRYTISGMLKDMGVEVIDMGVVQDSKKAIKSALSQAAAEADMIITSGGVSVGDADYIKQCLHELGQIHFNKLHLKPGRPLTFGQINNSHFFGLPGNPVAVMVTFMYFVRPAIKQLMGQLDTELMDIKIPCENALRKLPGRTEIQRGILVQDPQQGLIVKTTGKQGSGVLSSMTKGNCFIYLDHNSESIEVGDKVIVHPFSLF